MTKNANLRKYVPIAATVVLVIIIVITVVIYKLRNNTRAPQSSEIPTFQDTDSKQNIQTDQANIQTGVDNNKVNINPSVDIPVPVKPTFTMSSGNNGPVPAGANMNYICSAQPNIDCSIVLVSGTKQIVLGPTRVTDNGRGQYFASFYWTSVKGSYKVTAQAKNIQGGVSSSISQALEVQ